MSCARHRPAVRPREAGFTLVELLVGMAILAVLLAAVFSFQQSTTEYATTQNNQATRLQTVNDIAGYVGDRLRAAGGIAPSSMSLPNGTAAGTSETCSATGTRPCLAALLPVVEDARGAAACTPAVAPGRVVGWTLTVYRYVPRAELESTLRGPDNATLDQKAYGLVEIRLNDPSRPPPVAGTCGTRQSTPAAISQYTQVAARNLITDQAAVGSAAPFEVDTALKTVTLRVQTVTAQGTKLTYTPSAAPYKLTVNTRNVP